MNIFTTDPCPQKCAKYLDNKRVVKMALETTQILCTAVNEIAGRQVAPYKSTHKHHPCVKWAMDSIINAKWLHQHGHALCDEYKKRYGKEHKCRSVLDKFGTKNQVKKETYTPSSFPNCARNKSLGIDYTNEPNVFIAYQKYLNDRWDNDKLEPKWA